MQKKERQNKQPSKMNKTATHVLNRKTAKRTFRGIDLLIGVQRTLALPLTCPSVEKSRISEMILL